MNIVVTMRSNEESEELHDGHLSDMCVAANVKKLRLHLEQHGGVVVMDENGRFHRINRVWAGTHSPREYTWGIA